MLLYLQFYKREAKFKNKYTIPPQNIYPIVFLKRLPLKNVCDDILRRHVNVFYSDSLLNYIELFLTANIYIF